MSAATIEAAVVRNPDSVVPVERQHTDVSPLAATTPALTPEDLLQFRREAAAQVEHARMIREHEENKKKKLIEEDPEVRPPTKEEIHQLILVAFGAGFVSGVAVALVGYSLFSKG